VPSAADATGPPAPSGPPGARIALSRLPDDRVLVVEDGDARTLPLDALTDLVAAREPEQPRWVWDDTARWYPPLLAAGVRVERVHDLRLCHRLLRRAPAVDPALLLGDESDRWDRLAPPTPRPAALFALDDDTDHLHADLEDERQRRAVAASPEASRLALLLAAESSGALAAAEMTHAGVPWSVAVHERLLTDLLGRRPPRGARPALLEALVDDVRTILGAPGLNPDSRPELLAALRRVGLEAADTRASTLRALDHPAIAPLLRYKQLAHLFQTTGWAWIDQWVDGGRFRPSYQPAGSATGRWSSNGGGALSFPAQVRPAAVADEGWVLVVADVAQLEPRVLAGMSGDRALATAARGNDLYQGMVDQGAVATRDAAKLGLLGAMYGATSGESGRMVADLTRRYPAAFGLVEDAARAGERGEVVRTLLGRGSPGPAATWGSGPEGEGGGDGGEGGGPAPADHEQQARHRRAHGRFTRNFVVQGTGAEWALCWIADLRNRLWRLGGAAGGGPVDARPHLVFFLHDEVVVHTPAQLADAVVAATTEAAATASGLLFRDIGIDFPLRTSVVRCYADAGKAGAPGAVDVGEPPASCARRAGSCAGDRPGDRA
jgi:DNA polymerase-1